MKKICFIPIDNRPVTYSLVNLIAKINNNIEVLLPRRNFLGSLTKKADINQILTFIKNTNDIDLIVLSLDTTAYGGLVSSRRGNETFDEIKSRIDELKEIIISKKRENKNLKVYATSSVMRISNNNVNEEEKKYWDKYGSLIFKYSYDTHKIGTADSSLIPEDILKDYLLTRKRNFEINKIYLEFLKENIFDYLVFSKDDTGKFGLNVQEAEILDSIIKKENLNAIIKTGADEIPLGLFLRGITEDKKIKIAIKYSNPKSVDKISRYEDISVEKCVEAQIALGVQNAEIVDINPDIIFYINNFDTLQGDLVFQDVINNSDSKLEFDNFYMIADINNANGADKGLISGLISSNSKDKFLGYSGWNTSANTIGSALAIGIVSYLAKKEKAFNENAFKKLIAIRLLDDWAYQAEIRKKVRESRDFINFLNNNIKLFKPYEDKIKSFLNIDFTAKYSLPWNRSFEIEINL